MSLFILAKLVQLSQTEWMASVDTNFQVVTQILDLIYVLKIDCVVWTLGYNSNHYSADQTIWHHCPPESQVCFKSSSKRFSSSIVLYLVTTTSTTTLFKPLRASQNSCVYSEVKLNTSEFCLLVWSLIKLGGNVLFKCIRPDGN